MERIMPMILMSFDPRPRVRGDTHSSTDSDLPTLFRSTPPREGRRYR